MTDTPNPAPKSGNGSPPDPPKFHIAGRVDSHGPRFPNPPESGIPDAETLRENWRYAIRQYSKWYSHAWGTAILAGLSFFALGWFIKGSNPIASFKSDGKAANDSASGSVEAASADVHKPR